MALEMFWGGAPQPINTPEEALAQLRANEFALHEESESDHDHWSPRTAYLNPQTGETVKFNNEEPNKRRVIGGLAAVSKRITADYDSDDARIIELKQQSYSDDFVASKLREEGRIRYVGKTVGSRWLRLRKVLEERDDERLDDELSDWHVGEDDELKTIKEEVDKKFNVQFQRLRDKMWHEVSIYLAEKMAKRKYTAKACRERYDGLKDGSALLPIELDDDQAGRRKIRDERVAAAKARRAAVEQEKRDLAEARVGKTEEKRQQKIDEVIRRQQEMLRKEDERKERERRKKDKDAIRIRAREAREQYLEHMRLEREWEMEMIRVEKLVFKQMTGKSLLCKSTPRDRASLRKQGVTSGWESDEEDLDEMVDSASDADDEDDHDRAESASNFQSDRPKNTPHKKRALPARKARAKTISATTLAAAVEADETDETAAQSGNGGTQCPTKVPVTRTSLLNPRSILNMGELKAIIHRRDITPRWKEGETHPEVVARLAQIDESLKVEDLRDLCRRELLSASGRKDDLVRRLAAHDADRSIASRVHNMASADLEFMIHYREGYGKEFKSHLDEAIQEARDRGEQEGRTSG